MECPNVCLRMERCVTPKASFSTTAEPDEFWNIGHVGAVIRSGRVRLTHTRKNVNGVWDRFFCKTNQTLILV